MRIFLVVKFTFVLMLLLTGSSQSRGAESSEPSVSISKDPIIPVMVVSEDKDAVEVKIGEKSPQVIRGVQIKLTATVKAVQQLSSASVIQGSKRTALGGFETKKHNSADGAQLIEIVIELDVPKGTRLVDLSALTLKGSNGKLDDLPLGFDLFPSKKPVEFVEFVAFEDGLTIVEASDDAMRKTFKGDFSNFINVKGTKGNIFYLGPKTGAARPLPLRLLFQIPDSAADLSLEVLPERQAKEKKEGHK